MKRLNSKSHAAFLRHVRCICDLHNIDLYLGKGETIKEEGAQAGTCHGVFDESTLSVATGKEESNWIGVLAHEYSHMIQYLTDERVWYQESNAKVDSCTVLSRPTLFSDLTVHEAVRMTVEVEWDAEKRAVETIKEWDLEVDLDEYCRIANSYLWLIHMTPETNKGYNYLHPEIVQEQAKVIGPMDQYRVLTDQRKNRIQSILALIE